MPQYFLSCDSQIVWHSLELSCVASKSAADLRYGGSDCLLEANIFLVLRTLSDFVRFELFRESVSALLSESSELVRVASGNNEGSGDGISNNNRNQVLVDDISNSNLGSQQNCTGHDEEVGNTVFQTNRNESRDGEPASDKLSDEVVGSTSHEDSKRNHPVTQDSLDDG